MHLTHIVLHVKLFCLEHGCLYPGFAKELNESLRLGQPLECTEEQQGSLLLHLLIVAVNLLFCF